MKTPGPCTSLILLAGIWIAFCGLWITLVLAKAPDGGTVEVADRPGPGRLARPLLRLETPTGDRWLGEGYARVELERAAAVLQEGVRTARASLAVVGTPPLA